MRQSLAPYRVFKALPVLKKQLRLFALKGMLWHRDHPD